MTALLIIWLAMGKRQLAEITPFDFAVSLTAGTVAGAGIADPRIDVVQVIMALFLIGFLQIFISWLSLKFRKVHNKLNYEPTVLLENGQIIKKNLKRTRLTAEALLQLLREKDVFDIREVELAVLEPHGKLSVLKKAEFLPLTPEMVKLSVPPNQVLSPVIVEGKLQENIFRRIGFNDGEIADFKQQYSNEFDNIFVAFMDKNKKLHIIREDAKESDLFIH